MKNPLQKVPRTGLWTDVFPSDGQSRRYMSHAAWSTIPFILIAILALIFDAFTHFPVEIGVTTYEVGGGILVLFLVLRTNSGYERWWEARKNWGGITNQCRSLATAAVAFSPDPQWQSQLIRWTILFAHATRHRLRLERDLPEAVHLIGAEAARELEQADHPPLLVALRIAELLQHEAERIPSAVLMQMERDRISLLDYLGACERILTTPFPRSYNIVMRQFLVAFLAAFPFGILQKVTWLAPVLTAFVAFPMLALDEIGTELHHPFSKQFVNHLPLDEICKNIENNLLSLLPPDGQAITFVDAE